VGANKIEDSADRLVLSNSQAPAELLQKERRTLGRAQHEHDVHCGYVDAFIEQIHREHDLDPPLSQTSQRVPALGCRAVPRHGES